MLCKFHVLPGNSQIKQHYEPPHNEVFVEWNSTAVVSHRRTHTSSRHHPYFSLWQCMCFVCKIWPIRNGKVTIFTGNKSWEEIATYTFEDGNEYIFVDVATFQLAKHTFSTILFAYTRISSGSLFICLGKQYECTEQCLFDARLLEIWPTFAVNIW